MTTAVPPLPAELQARLDEIMARRPADSPICHAHWAMLALGPEFTPMSCACKSSVSIPDQRLIRQIERGEWATTDAELRGTHDDIAARALAQRERIRAAKRKK